MTPDRSSDTDPDLSPNNEGNSPSTDQVSVDESYRLLASTRRRVLLSCLTTRSDDVVPFDELVDVIAEHEHPDSGPADHWARIEVDLHHVHLPQLADAGVVDYDPVAETVEYNESQPLETLLSTSTALEERSR